MEEKVAILSEMLSNFTFSCESSVEEDGSVTLSLNEMDLVDNAPTFEKAKVEMGNDILEYAKEYYENFQMYYHAPNRKAHFPYVMKALFIYDGIKIGEGIKCECRAAQGSSKESFLKSAGKIDIDENAIEELRKKSMI